MNLVDRLFDIPPDIEVRNDGIWAWLKTYGVDGCSLVRTGERCLLTPHCALAHGKALLAAYMEWEAMQAEQNVREMKRGAG